MFSQHIYLYMSIANNNRITKTPNARTLTTVKPMSRFLKIHQVLQPLREITTGIIRKMVKSHDVHGYEELIKLVETLEPAGGPIHILFCGGKEENGKSWCPYCVEAEPVVANALSHAAENSHFIHCDVGEKT